VIAPQGRIDMSHMEIRNKDRAIRYATILHLCNYSKKLMPPGDLLPSLFDIQNIGNLFKTLSEVLSAKVDEVARCYTKFKKSFDSFPSEYTVLYHQDADYPRILRETSDPPLFIFCRGQLRLFQEKGISVVGSRNASELGIRRAQKLSMLLTASGYVVVSGLAKGIDTAAHSAAIGVGGKTIAVIGTPLDKCYPSENRGLQERISIGHLLVSQFPFGFPVRPYNFPIRNYTMSGLSYATVVVEASETSGALIQARQCMAQGRHLFILKSLLERKDIDWPAKYVKKGAFVIERVEDVPEYLQRLPSYDLTNDEMQHRMAY
jgi:DNA processing protein